MRTILGTLVDILASAGRSWWPHDNSAQLTAGTPPGHPERLSRHPLSRVEKGLWKQL